MTSRNILYWSIFVISLVTSYACNQRISDEIPSRSSNIELFKTLQKVDPNSRSKHEAAVIYRSIDLGVTWSSFDNGIPADATLSGIKQYGNKIYVSTDYHGVYFTSDGQNNWSALNALSLKDLDINCIEVEANRIIVGTLKHGVLESQDGGLSWNSSKVNINSPIRAFIKSGSSMYAGTDAGIFKSTDMGSSWSHVFGKMQILGFTLLNDNIYAATQNGALMGSDNMLEWKSIYEGDALHDIGNDGHNIYAMTIGQKLLKTQNDGELWENAQNGIVRPPNFYTNELQHIGNDVFSAQWIGIYHSTNNGNSWQILDGLPDSTAFSTLQITDYGIIAGISIR